MGVLRWWVFPSRVASHEPPAPRPLDDARMPRYPAGAPYAGPGSVRDDQQTDWRAALAGTGVAVAMIGLVVALGIALGTYRDRPLWGVVLSSIAVAFVASA